MSEKTGGTLALLSTGDAFLAHRWVALASQPVYVSALAKLRETKRLIHEAEESGQVDAHNASRVDLLEAEIRLTSVTDRLHQDLCGLLTPSVRALIRCHLNALEALIRWQSFLAVARVEVQSTGFALTGMPFQASVTAALNYEPKHVLALLIAIAMANGVITTDEATQLMSGKQISTQLPTQDQNFSCSNKAE